MRRFYIYLILTILITWSNYSLAGFSGDYSDQFGNLRLTIKETSSDITIKSLDQPFPWYRTPDDQDVGYFNEATFKIVNMFPYDEGFSVFSHFSEGLYLYKAYFSNSRYEELILHRRLITTDKLGKVVSIDNDTALFFDPVRTKILKVYENNSLGYVSGVELIRK